MPKISPWHWRDLNIYAAFFTAKIDSVSEKSKIEYQLLLELEMDLCPVQEEVKDYRSFINIETRQKHLPAKALRL